jgi:hypothetical protein
MKRALRVVRVLWANRKAEIAVATSLVTLAVQIAQAAHN